MTRRGAVLASFALLVAPQMPGQRATLTRQGADLEIDLSQWRTITFKHGSLVIDLTPDKIFQALVE